MGGLPEVVEHGVSGYLAPVGDVDAMARYSLEILRRLRGGEEASRGRRARRAVEKFDYSTIVPQYEAIYERVLGA